MAAKPPLPTTPASEAGRLLAQQLRIRGAKGVADILAHYKLIHSDADPPLIGVTCLRRHGGDSGAIAIFSTVLNEPTDENAMRAEALTLRVNQLDMTIVDLLADALNHEVKAHTRQGGSTQ